MPWSSSNTAGGAHSSPKSLTSSSVSSSSSSGILPDPGFVGHLRNVTVPEGRDVALVCTVKNLGAHKVAWIHYDRNAILTVQNHVITRNPRIGVSHEGRRTWKLHIRDVQDSDQGAYMCQINTPAAKTRVGFLNVVVPPKIEDSLSSGDKVRTEGSNVTLECTARGSPEPRVTWRRQDGNNIDIDKSRNLSLPNVEGRILRLYRVSRLDMGVYMCIAKNGIPPAVSKTIRLGIDFPPMMWVPDQQLRAVRGGSVTLSCVVESHPEALTFWHHAGRIVQPRGKFFMSTVQGKPSYKVEMRLQVENLAGEDFGNYTCIAKNPRGNVTGVITLTERIPPTTTTLEPPPTPPETTAQPDAVAGKQGFKNSDEEGVRKRERKKGGRGEGRESTREKSRKEKLNREQQQLSQRTTVYDNDPWFTPHSSSATSTVPRIVVTILPLLTWLRRCFSTGY